MTLHFPAHQDVVGMYQSRVLTSFSLVSFAFMWIRKRPLALTFRSCKEDLTKPWLGDVALHTNYAPSEALIASLQQRYSDVRQHFEICR